MTAEKQSGASMEDWILKQYPYWAGSACMDKKKELFRRIAETKIAEQNRDFKKDAAFDGKERSDGFLHFLLRRLQDIAVFCPELKDKLEPQIFAVFLSGMQVIGCYQNALDNHLTDMPWGEWFMRHTAYLDKIGFTDRMEQHIKRKQTFDKWAALLPKEW